MPLFQRPYSWERKEWQALWDGIVELCAEDHPRTHFLGSIVTMAVYSVPEGVSQYLLIDGQQQLQSFQRFWGMGELSIHRWKGFELYPVINKKTVIPNESIGFLSLQSI